MMTNWFGRNLITLLLAVGMVGCSGSTEPARPVDTSPPADIRADRVVVVDIRGDTLLDVSRGGSE
ncbi:hypothetical protein BH23GEM8_BH23GEM8_06830 [soil metagenome]